MKTTTCRHLEKVDKLDRGVERGTCKICHQVRQYNTLDLKDKPKIVKLGRINGAIVLPGSKDSLLLADQEGKELTKAIKEAESVPAPAAEEAAVVEKPQAEEKEVAAAAPQKPRHSSFEKTQARVKYLEEHKAEIIQDYQKLKLKEFFRKWHISSGSWAKLKLFWQVKSKGYRNRPGRPKAGKETPAQERPKGPPSIEDIVRVFNELKENIRKEERLPRFPDWAPEKWVSSEIAVQWLKSYEALNRLILIKHQLERSQPISSEAVREAERILAEKAKRRCWLTRLFRRS